MIATLLVSMVLTLASPLARAARASDDTKTEADAAVNCNCTANGQNNERWTDKPRYVKRAETGALFNEDGTPAGKKPQDSGTSN